MDKQPVQRFTPGELATVSRQTRIRIVSQSQEGKLEESKVCFDLEPGSFITVIDSGLHQVSGVWMTEDPFTHEKVFRKVGRKREVLKVLGLSPHGPVLVCASQLMRLPKRQRNGKA